MIQMSISQYSKSGEPQVLTRFRSAMSGRGRIYGPFQGRPTHFIWQAAGRAAVASLRDLWPHLGAVKQEQVARALARVGEGGWSAQKASTSLAWCAGLFDSDGSIGLIRVRRARAPGYFGIHATVTQSSANGIPDVLTRFRDGIGGLGTINGPSRRPGVLDVYRWQTQRPDAVKRLICLLSPWLGVVKREQALRALNVIQAQPRLRRGGGHLGYRKRICIRGHDFSDALLYERTSHTGRPYLQRVCRECRRTRDGSARARGAITASG